MTSWGYKNVPEQVFDGDHVIDGSTLADVRAAIQAAWHADPAFAAQLAKRYGLYDKVCLRCVERGLAALEPHAIVRSALGSLAYQLCVQCMTLELRERRISSSPAPSNTSCDRCGKSAATTRLKAFGVAYDFCDACINTLRHG